MTFLHVFAVRIQFCYGIYRLCYGKISVEISLNV